MFGLKGACLSIDTACSSSLVGAHYGARDTAAGDCTRALAAGVNLTLSPAKTSAFAITGESFMVGLDEIGYTPELLWRCDYGCFQSTSLSIITTMERIKHVLIMGGNGTYRVGEMAATNPDNHTVLATQLA